MFARAVPVRLLLSLCSVVLVAAACSSDSDAAGVASLETPGAGSDEGAPESDQSSEEALLAYSQCMRDEGLGEFPDPVVEADGSVGFGLGPGTERAFDPRSDEFQAAQSACEGLLGDATFGGGRFGGGDQAARNDAFVAYSECLRSEGLDVGDLVPGQGGGPGDGAPDDGAGPPPGGPEQGDRSGRIADAMGLDPDDPAVQDALAVCDPVLQEAIGGVGPAASSAEEA